MALRVRLVPLILLVLLIAGGFLVTEYLEKAEQRRDDERRAVVTQLQRTIDQRSQVPTEDGSLRTKATGGLAELGAAPDRPEDTVIHYAVDPKSKTYFVCTLLEKGGAFYAGGQGTLSGPAESCSPDADPVALGYALDARMTGAGTTAFLRAKPRLVSKQFIQRECASAVDEGQLQGCFTGDRIYLIDLPEQKIHPEVSVTAAHEMLHAAWERLDPKEQQRVGKLLNKLIRTNSELSARAETYDRASRMNEMHSIVGTEESDIGAELEQHFAQYLADRKLIAQRHQRYTEVLDDLTAEIERLKRELEELRERADGLLAGGDVDGYNALVNPYNELVLEINRKVREFNRLTEHTRPDGQVPTVDAR